MADLDACINGVVSMLGTAIPGLRVSSYQAQVNPPAAVVVPQIQQNLKFDTFEGGVSYMLRVVLLVAYTDDASSTALMNSYLSTTGANSVPAAFKANQRLAGVYDNVNLDSIRAYGLADWAGQQYLQAQGLVTVMTT